MRTVVAVLSLRFRLKVVEVLKLYISKDISSLLEHWIGSESLEWVFLQV